MRLDAAERQACAEQGLTVVGDVEFGHTREWQATLVELPGKIEAGRFAVDAIGAYSYLGGRGSELDHVAMIGRFCSIASGVVIGLPEHPAEFLSAHPLFEGAAGWAPAPAFRSANAAMIARAQGVLHQRRQARFGKVEIGHDVWIGEGAFVRRGVTIGNGAVVAARAVVVDDVPPYAIVAGVPARVVRYRFEPGIVAALEALGWWQYDLSVLDGVDVTDIGAAVARIEHNIAGGARPLDPAMLALIRDEPPALVARDGDGGISRTPLA